MLGLHFTPACVLLCLQSAFYTQSAFYPWSVVRSLQSAVRSLRLTLTVKAIHVQKQQQQQQQQERTKKKHGFQLWFVVD